MRKEIGRGLPVRDKCTWLMAMKRIPIIILRISKKTPTVTKTIFGIESLTTRSLLTYCKGKEATSLQIPTNSQSKNHNERSPTASSSASWTSCLLEHVWWPGSRRPRVVAGHWSNGTRLMACGQLARSCSWSGTPTAS